MSFISTIYKTSRSALSGLKHEAIAECFGSDKARTLYTTNLYTWINVCQFMFSKAKIIEENVRRISG